MIRSMSLSDNNPYTPSQAINQIKSKLNKFTFGQDYDIMVVPNITNIGYGRDVGYSITQYDLGEEIHSISGTKIRNEGKPRTDDTSEYSD